MGDAASVESVNILVDIVISVVLRRLNSDLENVDSERLSAACELSGSVASGLSDSVWLWGRVCACCVRRGTGRKLEEGERCVQSESVLSFYFTNKQKT